MSFFDISDDATAESASHADDLAVLVARGEIDYSASPELSELLVDRVIAGIRRFVIDVSKVTFIDSTAIGALVGAVMRLQESGGGSMVIVCAPENQRVLRIFEMAGIDSLIALHSSREDALLELAAAG
jgi:anti-sigma B factor antagonist